MKVIEPLTNPPAGDDRVPRRVSVASWLWLERQAVDDGLGYAEDRRDVDRAHGAARLRPLRRTGRRLGLRGNERHRRDRQGPLRRDPSQHDHRPALERDAGRTHRAEQKAFDDYGYHQTVGDGVLDPAVDPSANAWLRVGRFTCRPDELDHREVLAVVRLRRASRERAHARRDARQRDALLASGQRRVVGQVVLGELPLTHVRSGSRARVRVGVPERDLPSSRRFAEPLYDIRYWNELDKGGHFAAFEQPELFVGELRAAFTQFV